MKKIIFTIALMVSLLGCKPPSQVRFTVVNESSTPLSNVNISVMGSYSIPIGDVEIDKAVSKIFTDEKFPNTDGEFILRFKQGEKSIEREFGYFTNGGLLWDFEVYTMIVRDDTSKLYLYIPEYEVKKREVGNDVSDADKNQ